MERIPYQATPAAAAYQDLRLPVSILLDNVRSMYNVGAFFRTADAAGVEKLYLCGITAHPPKLGIEKTALGAEMRVRWEHSSHAPQVITRLRAEGRQIVAIETSSRAQDLFDWRPAFPVCVIFGHEVGGIRPELLECCDTHIRIPMLGVKHSLNVATAGGVVVYELLRKYRRLIEAARGKPKA